MKMIRALKNFLSFFIQVYSLIGTGFCKHVSGKLIYRCKRHDVSSQSLCEDYCTSWNSCVGYHYDIKDNEDCYLIPSDKGCPSGFKRLSKSGPIAASMNDLKAFLPRWVCSRCWVCYGKI